MGTVLVVVISTPNSAAMLVLPRLQRLRPRWVPRRTPSTRLSPPSKAAFQWTAAFFANCVMHNLQCHSGVFERASNRSNNLRFVLPCEQSYRERRRAPPAGATSRLPPTTDQASLYPVLETCIC